MNLTLLKIAKNANPDLALTAFTRFRRLVQTGLKTEADVFNSLLASANIPRIEASATISQAFDLTRRKEATE
jgi:hypothetical protein